jgi:hypothetical protein
MSLLRGLLFENLGLKFTALMLAALVYFNALTERPAKERVSFPIALQDLPDSLAIAGPVPRAVEAEIRGLGKPVLRMKYFPPAITVSLAGVRAGHFERSLNAADLPLTSGVEVERLVGPRMVVLELDRRMQRRLPVASRLEWTQSAAARPVGMIVLEPAAVIVSGPARVIARLDTVDLGAVRIDGRRDTVRSVVAPQALPEGCTAEPSLVRITVVLGHP